MARTAAFPSLPGRLVDPLAMEAVAGLAEENASFVSEWRADVFLSSWISSSGSVNPACAELALVHDCLPERLGTSLAVRELRNRWLSRASVHLAVSADTAADVERLLRTPRRSVAWCHPAPAQLFASTVLEERAAHLWVELCNRAGLHQPYVLLPATSAIGSYKNPEVLAVALADSSLKGIHLVLCGIAADQRRLELEARFPHLQGRCRAAGFTDLELALAYRQAIAVVVPSHAEGFGLPVVEALAAGATVLIADSRGLREAGAGAALRFASDRPRQLAALLQLLIGEDEHWLPLALARRAGRRLASLHADLLGLTLLALARTVQPSDKVGPC